MSAPSPQSKPNRHLRSIRLWLFLVILGLAVSGITAFPLQHELDLLVRLHPPNAGLNAWLLRVDHALVDTNARYPFLAYGTDWLAFAHLVIAILFIGPYRDPIRNEWVVTWGVIASAGVFALALIAGPIRGIPPYWRLIDCSFGAVCAAVLFRVRTLTRRLQQS